MRHVVAALMTALTVVQCSVVDIFAPRLGSPLIARPIVAVYTGMVAHALTGPVMGRFGSSVAMLAMTAVTFLLPIGWGLSGVLLLPLSLTLLRQIDTQEKRDD